MAQQLRIHVVTAVVQVTAVAQFQSLAQELLHAADAAKKKKKKKNGEKNGEGKYYKDDWGLYYFE